MSKRKDTPNIMSQIQGLPKRPEAPKSDPEPVKKTKKPSLAGRATYQIGEELKAAIKAESVRLGVPASQLAKYLLLFAWDDYANGRISPPTLRASDSPKFRNTIDFD